MTVKIFLADDHTIFRQGLRLLLEEEPDIKVIAEAGSGTEVIEAIEKVRPTILIADIRMPGPNGIKLTKKVRMICPETQVIILSMFGDEIYVLNAFENGARGFVIRGFVIREASGEELILAIREVLSGRCFVSERIITDRIMKKILNEKSLVRTIS